MDEVVTQMQKPDAIVVSVGGGGLSCGILQGLKNILVVVWGGIGLKFDLLNEYLKKF